VEQENLMDAQQSVLPMVVRWEQAVQRDLFNPNDPAYPKFSMASLLRGDFATRTAGYAVAVEHGWLSPDDVRELEDMNPISGGIGKQYFRPMNWTTLDAKPISEPSDPGGDPSDNAEDADNDSATDQPGGVPDPDDAKAVRIQLELLAQDTAARCVRREVGAGRKLIDNRSDGSEVAPFYAEHFRFICTAFHLKPLQSLKEKSIIDARSDRLRLFLSDGDYVSAKEWIDGIAISEPAKLAALAVEGVL
jgi:hypothetical protein